MKTKDNLLRSPLLPIGIILVFGAYLLLFEYEEVPTVQQRILKLEEERNLFRRFLLHMETREKFSPEKRKAVAALKKRKLINITVQQLQKELSQMVESSRLRLLEQHIGKSNSWGELVGVGIEQRLEGDYNKQLDYLNRIENSNMLLLVKDYHLKNLMLTASDPMLSVKIELRCFYLKQ